MRVTHARCDCSEVQNDLLRVLCLSRTGLAGDEDALVLACALSDGKDVWQVLIPSLPAVLLFDFLLETRACPFTISRASRSRWGPFTSPMLAQRFTFQPGCIGVRLRFEVDDSNVKLLYLLL